MGSSCQGFSRLEAVDAKIRKMGFYSRRGLDPGDPYNLTQE